MDCREREEILRNAALVDERERARGQEQPLDRYAHMSELDKSKYIDILKDDLRSLQATLADKDRELERLRHEVEKQALIAEDSNKKLGELLRMVRDDRDERKKLQDLVDSLRKQLADANEKLRLASRMRFGASTQKSKSAKSKAKDADDDRSKDKDDFDGTHMTPDNRESAQSSADKSPSEKNEDSSLNHEADSDKAPSLRQLMAYQERLGSSYNTMTASNVRTHRCDMNRLPDGAVFIRKGIKTVYSQETVVTQHNYETVVYRKDGKIYEAYLPADGEPEFIDRVPGTHASSDLMAYLGFNHFSQDVPSYREVEWLLEHGMSVSRQTLSNWLRKAGNHLCAAIEHLKDIALEKDSIVNCDETWCRVKVYDTYRKKYIWCLVNRKAGIAIFIYDDGSRSREVLKYILDGRELKALQSDAYNVYMFIDKSLVDMDHLCYMAHARAKFSYAAEQGDNDAVFFLDQIGKLYAREALFKKCGFSPAQIQNARNNPEALEIIGLIRSKLDSMMADGHPPRGDLMDKALNYINNFWDQLFMYRKDGNYEIDNNLAERTIRPLTRFRKNCLFYGSTWMAETAASFHTMIATCRMQGVSVMQYLKKFFSEIARGNLNYGNLLPMTIGLPVNNC